jgi:hypothetical protein
MATVKFTQSIRCEVTNKIDTAYTARIQSKQNEIHSTITADFILETYINLTGGLELYESCKHWLAEESSIRCNSINGTHLSETYFYFKDEHGQHTYKRVPCIPYPYNLKDPSLQPFVDNYLTLKTELITLREECTKQKNSICSAFEAYGSVNSAIKEHPELANMLSSKTLAKINEKKERAKASDVVVNIDLGMVNTIAVLSKFAEAK